MLKPQDYGGLTVPGVEVAKKLSDHFPRQVLEVSVNRAGRTFIRISKDGLRDIVSFLAGEGFTHLLAITALNIEDSLEVLYHLSGNGILVTLRVTLSQNEHVIPTITDIIPGAILHEREVHDLFGIKFEGNPDLRPLILPEDWPAGTNPMRKRK